MRSRAIRTTATPTQRACATPYFTSPAWRARASPGTVSGGEEWSDGRQQGYRGSGQPASGDTTAAERPRRAPPPALLIALAAILLVVSVFCGLSLASTNGVLGVWGEQAAHVHTRIRSDV